LVGTADQSEFFFIFLQMSHSTTDLVYWDGAFTNSELTPQNISITESRTIPLVDRAEDYDVAVDSFSIDTTDFGIFVCQPRTDGAGASINQLNYWVQYQWGAFTPTAFLLMQTNYPTDAPASISATNNLSNPLYYGIYSYAQFISMINVALASCFVDLQAAGFPGPYTPPYVTMNSDTGILVLVVPQTFNTANVAVRIESDLMDILNLPYTSIMYNPATTLALPKHIGYELASTIWTNYSGVRPSTWFLSQTLLAAQIASTEKWAQPAYYIGTDHDYRAAWYDVYQIVLISNMAAQESISSATFGASTQSSAMNILASYTLDLSGDQHLNGQLLYVPQFYKWISILPQGPIQTIQVQFMYATRRGTFYPLRQTFGRNASVRLIFKKRLSESLDKKRKSDEDDWPSKRLKY